MAGTDIEGTLEEIRARIDDIEQSPRTTLEIIDRETQEDDWEALLVYFLDPDNPHGFGTDVLEAFLTALSKHDNTDFSKPFQHLDQVSISTQVATGTGPVDILLWLEDAWFVCIELKAKSPETGTQTVRYANASRLGEIQVDEYDHAVYVYLAASYAPPPTSDQFIHIPWSHVVQYLEQVLGKGYDRYPAKSSAQLADYLHTLRKELNMSEADEISEETRLYIEYSDTINRLIEQYEEDRDTIFRSLDDAFFERSECSRDDWVVSTHSDRYMKFYKPVWQGLTNGVNIEYEPHVHLNQDSPEIRLRLDIEDGDKEAMRDNLRARLSERDLEELRDAQWEFTRGTNRFIAKTVSLNLDRPSESIHKAASEIHDFRAIVEPHIDAMIDDL